MTLTPPSAGPQAGPPPGTDHAPVRMSPRALKELDTLFPGEDVRHVRVIATPG